MPKKKKPAHAKPIGPVSVGIASPVFGVLSGIGSIAENLAGALRSQGASVASLDHPAKTGYSDAPAAAEGNVTATISLHPAARWGDTARPIFGLITEPSDAFDGLHAQHFRKATEVLCPSEWTRAAVARCAPVPASLLRLGIDAHAFPYRRRERGAKLRFLHFAVNNGDWRKGTDIAVSAFLKAFPDRVDVELVCRSTRPSMFQRNDPRVRAEYGPLAPAAFAEMLHGFDALLYTSRAEAFAPIALEAMASGLPVIHSGETGMSDFADLGIKVMSRSVPAQVGGGTWMEPYAEEVADRMHDIDTRYDAVMELAQNDAQAVRERYRWTATAQTFLSLL